MGDKVQCDPWPLEDLMTVLHRVAGGAYITDYRYGRVNFVLDTWLREDEAAPRTSMALIASCLPGRLLYQLLCAHKALLPVDGKTTNWDLFAFWLHEMGQMIDLAAGRGGPRDLMGLKGHQ